MMKMYLSFPIASFGCLLAIKRFTIIVLCSYDVIARRFSCYWSQCLLSILVVSYSLREVSQFFMRGFSEAIRGFRFIIELIVI